MSYGRKVRHAKALGLLILLVFVLLSQAGCASDPVRTVVESQVVEVPVATQVPIPHEFTDPLPYPEPFSQYISTEILVNQIFGLYDLLDRCNADRANVHALGEK